MFLIFSFDFSFFPMQDRNIFWQIIEFMYNQEMISMCFDFDFIRFACHYYFILLDHTRSNPNRRIRGVPTCFKDLAIHIRWCFHNLRSFTVDFNCDISGNVKFHYWNMIITFNNHWNFRIHNNVFILIWSWYILS